MLPARPSAGYPVDVSRIQLASSLRITERSLAKAASDMQRRDRRLACILRRGPAALVERKEPDERTFAGSGAEVLQFRLSAQARHESGTQSGAKHGAGQASVAVASSRHYGARSGRPRSARTGVDRSAMISSVSGHEGSRRSLFLADGDRVEFALNAGVQQRSAALTRAASALRLRRQAVEQASVVRSVPRRRALRMPGLTTDPGAWPSARDAPAATSSSFPGTRSAAVAGSMPTRGPRLVLEPPKPQVGPDDPFAAFDPDASSALADALAALCRGCDAFLWPAAAARALPSGWEQVELPPGRSSAPPVVTVLPHDPAVAGGGRESAVAGAVVGGDGSRHCARGRDTTRSSDSGHGEVAGANGGDDGSDDDDYGDYRPPQGVVCFRRAGGADDELLATPPDGTDGAGLRAYGTHGAVLVLCTCPAGGAKRMRTWQSLVFDEHVVTIPALQACEQAQLLRELVASIDADGDGVLSAGEVGSVLAAAASARAGKAAARGGSDSDGGSQLSDEDGGSVPTGEGPAADPAEVAALLAAVGADAAQEITTDELLLLLLQRWRHEWAMRNMFQLIDADGSGSITEAELHQAVGARVFVRRADIRHAILSSAATAVGGSAGAAATGELDFARFLSMMRSTVAASLRPAGGGR